MMHVNAPAILYGCADAACGYRTVPSTMGTPYKKCPLCGAPWIANPPPQLEHTGKTITEFHNGKKTRTIIVRPHMLHKFNALEKEKRR